MKPDPATITIADKRQLVENLEQGCKPRHQWRIGTEHEKFGYRLDDLRPLAYEGEQGIRAMLEGLQRFGWEPVLEHGLPIALAREGCSITLEPGGQLELSGEMLETVHETCSEVHTHLDQVQQVARELSVGFIGMGFQPKWKREDIPWMPKERYKIMRRYMQTVGSLGLDMMTRTCTVQTNLDFESEADMVRKFRVSLALQPVATALFANSPFTEGQPNSFMSYRSHVWTDTDPDRTGVLPFVFEDGMGFERYVEYMLDVPMYFVMRNGDYIDAAGQSFRDFLAGKLPVLPGEHPTLKDWADHLTTVFPEVRLKTFLEMRGADGGPWSILCALPALWVGLLYDTEVLDAAWDLVRDWDMAEHERLRREVPRQALKAKVAQATMREFALEVLKLSETGLRRRARLDSQGRDETIYLGPLFEIVESGRSPALEKLERFQGPWAGDIDRAFADYSY